MFKLLLVTFAVAGLTVAGPAKFKKGPIVSPVLEWLTDYYKVAINADLDMDTKTGPDGKKHWVIKDWRHSFDLKEKSDLVFENLFEKNEVLRSAASDLIDKNSNEVINEIGGPIFKALAEKIIKNIKALFDHVAYDDLSLD